MKVTIIGGSAYSTATLFSYLANYPNSRVSEISLLGRNTDSLASIIRVARILLRGKPTRITHEIFSEKGIKKSLYKTDIVITVPVKIPRNKIFTGV